MPIWRVGGVTAGSCSTDLRGRVLAAVEAGATPEAAARRFRAAERVGGGPGSGIAGEVGAVLLGPLGEANHLTLRKSTGRVATSTRNGAGGRITPRPSPSAAPRPGSARRRRAGPGPPRPRPRSRPPAPPARGSAGSTSPGVGSSRTGTNGGSASPASAARSNAPRGARRTAAAGWSPCRRATPQAVAPAREALGHDPRLDLGRPGPPPPGTGEGLRAGAPSPAPGPCLTLSDRHVSDRPPRRRRRSHVRAARGSWGRNSALMSAVNTLGRERPAASLTGGCDAPRARVGARPPGRR